MSTETLPVLGVLVVNYGSHALLRAHLAPLAARAPDTFVVVVDNRTDDVERQAVLALATEHRWHVVTPETNLGFGAGMNLAADRARALGAQQLLLLNPDAVLEPPALAALRTEVARKPRTMVSPTILRPDGSVFFEGSDLYLDSGRMRSRRWRVAPGRDDPRVRPWLSGACLLLDTRLWSASGGFDDDYFLYWEDVDLSHRVEAVGGELLVLPSVRVEHDEGGTSRAEQATDRARSDTYYYYNIRNRLLYARKHLSRRDRLRWALLSPLVAWEILLQGGRRQFLHTWRPLRTAASATIDGLLILFGRSRAGARHAVARELRFPAAFVTVPSSTRRAWARTQETLVSRRTRTTTRSESAHSRGDDS